MTTPNPIPEVRQCQDELDDLYGSTAVAGWDRSTGLWGVFHPSRGGHWAEPTEVAGWAVIQQPASFFVEPETDGKNEDKVE
jgi:hypothetical protein